MSSNNMISYKNIIIASKCKPRFQHDCDECEFVGQFGRYDLYHHGAAGDPNETVIARLSDEGGDYLSGMAFFYGASPELTIARALWETSQS